MAPEIYLGKPYTGQSVDLFAAAVTLFSMIAGRKPFHSAKQNDPLYFNDLYMLLVTDPKKFWLA